MVQFTKPLYLILLIPLVYYTYRVSRRSFSDLSRSRSRLALALRTAILMLLVLALAGARTVRDVSQQCVVFVVDLSDSVPKPKQDAAVAYINRALRGIKPHQKAAIVVFGGNASVELAPSNASKVEKIRSVPETGHTDISQALGLALAVFPDRTAKKIVLLSDGNETQGKAVEQAMLAGSESVSIDVVPIGTEFAKEALLDKMICPSAVKIGEPFDIKVVATSTVPSAAQVRILRNGVPVDARAVQLTKGRTLLSFQTSIPKPGNFEFTAILDSNADTVAENNFALGYTMVKGKPRVLYVEGQKGQERFLSEALSKNDMAVDTRDRSGVPTSLAELRGYDMIVLSDVPAWSLAPEQMEMLRSGVKDLGIGFTMIGGEYGFGAGGYYDTPIERALPLDMSIKKTKLLPSLSVVIVMDKSGSMGAPEGGRTKIELANDAAASVVKLLQPIDQVGIIVCHSYPVAAVNLQPARSKDHIYDEISTIRAEGGGITVFPSMKMASEMISASHTRLKHIILLADGADCDEQGGVGPLVKEMAAKRITVTTVAIGDGPHVPFLKATAGAGRGDFYLARRASDLKAIFTKDVLTVSKALIVEEPFIPRMDPSSRELGGLDSAHVPPLLGYVATSPKPTASVSMVSHKKEPILATWQYGLGKSAAFTSDCKARWSARWLTWPDYSKFWSQVIRSTMRAKESQDFQTGVNIEGGTGYAAIDAVDESGNFLNSLKFKGSVVGPERGVHELAIEQTGPGHYEAAFPVGKPGNYLVNIVRRDQPDAAPEVMVVNIPYPPEYKEISINTGLLARLASESSGRFSPQPADIFGGSFRPSKAYTDLWRLLALIAALVLPVDIAVRRLTVTPAQLAEIFRRTLEHVRRTHPRRKKSEPVAGVESVSTLLRTKRERRASDSPITIVSPKPEAAERKQINETSAEDVTTRLLAAKNRAATRKEEEQ
ncbi:MAG: vWA domain-containing protein [Armatimonadota bacterium]